MNWFSRSCNVDAVDVSSFENSSHADAVDLSYAVVM